MQNFSRNTILVIDDSEMNRQIVKNIFEGSYQVVEAVNGREGLAKLKEHLIHIAAVILDMEMPVLSGMEFLHVYHTNANYVDIPVLVATSDEKHYEQQCLELGAVDFVTIPYDEKVLKYRVINAVQRCWFRNNTNDSLTGLYTKEMFQKEAVKTMVSHLGQQFVYVTVDLDNFKTYNLFFGAAEGDNLLQFLAGIVTEFMVDTPFGRYARNGADSFNMCFPYDEKLIQQIVQETVHRLHEYNRDYIIKPTFGVYIVEDPYMDINLIHDRAVIAAKKCKGRYREYVGYYDKQMGLKSFNDQQILNEVDNAIEAQQLVVFYQPKFNLKNGMTYGAEALVRWQHPKKGLLLPGSFIDVIEKNGFIGKLDYYVWEQVCIFLKSRLDAGKVAMPISVNVSLANLYNPRFIDMLSSLLDKYQTPVELFNLEFTESSFFENTEIIQNTMNELHKRGFRILMDDFGSGYSSLNMLRELPVDVLKIDRNFLPTEPTVDKGGRILAAVIRMAEWLKLPVVVEGAETADQVNFLRNIDCDFVQGFYFARPMSQEDYVSLLDGKTKQTQMPVQDTRKAALSALWSTDSMVEKLLDNIVEPVVIFEAEKNDLQILRVSPSFYRMFHISGTVNMADLLPGNVIGELGQSRIVLETHIAINVQGTSSCEIPCQLKDGKIWIHIKIQYVETIGTRHILTAVLTDITKRKDAEEALRSSMQEAKFQETYALMALKAANLISWEYDVQEKRIRLREDFENPFALAPVLDNVPECLLGTGKIHHDDEAKFCEMYRKLDQGALSAEGAFRFRSKRTDAYTYVLVRYSNTFDKNGKPYRAIGLMQDITELQEMKNSFQLEREFNEMLSPELLGLCMINASQHKLEKIQTGIAHYEEDIKTFDLARLRAFMRDYFIDDAKGRKFFEETDEAAVLRYFEQGTTQIHHTFMKLWRETGKRQWMSVDLQIRKREETGDIIAFCYVRDEDERVREMTRLEDIANRDAMTGLLNHEYALHTVQSFLNNEGKDGIHALFMIDVDNFKNINDTYGHVLGDAAIMRMSEKLTGLFRTSDIIGRFGGDEFIVFMKGAASVQLVKLKAEQLAEALQLSVTKDGVTVEFTCCVGVSIIQNGDKDGRQMIAEADQQMYVAKKKGKNRYSY